MTSCEKDDPVDDQNPNTKSATIKEEMEVNAEYSHMNEAVEESNKSAFFSKADADMTVFVANNQAFEKLFTKANVTSVSELEAKMGEAAFARMVMYHAVNGRFDYDSFESGNRETYASANSNQKLTLLVERDNGNRLKLNGSNANGATTTGTEVIEASNGNIIEVDGVLNAQTNFENIEDAETHNNSGMYMDMMANADAGIASMLGNSAEHSQVLVSNDAQMDAILNLYLRDILDEDDLDNLLSAAAETQLFTQYSVNTMADLLAEISLNDLVSIGMITTADVYAEMEVDDRSEYMQHLIFKTTNDLKTEAENTGSASTEAGVSYSISTTNEGNLSLTDTDGNEFILQQESANSVNGSVYTIQEIR